MSYVHGEAGALSFLGLEKTASSALRKLFRVVEEAPGRFQAYLGSRPLNTMYVDPVSQSVSTLTAVPKDLAGMGLAKKLYGEVMRRMPNQTLRSDSRGVTLDAREVWRGMEKRPGYTLHETPNWRPYGPDPLFSASLPPSSAVGSAAAGPVPRTTLNVAADASALAATRAADRAQLTAFQEADKTLRTTPHHLATDVWRGRRHDFEDLHRAVRGRGPPVPLRWQEAYQRADPSLRQYMDQALRANPQTPEAWDAWQVLDNRISGL